ncbi:MAG TPA: glycosyltransferase family 2 protein [Nitrospiraceae bacterium]|nr:glycosyltransferase family 2 protein [Nitrospiraceae bacterium]
MPKASIIVVNYNGQDCVIDCLKALKGQLFQDFEIIVVDNASSDDSLGEIRSFLQKSPFTGTVRIIPLEDNLGFAGGNVVGLRYTEAEYIALLNNDAEPDRKWLHNLINVMDTEPNVGICASKMIVAGSRIIDSAGDGHATLLKGFKRGEGESAEKYDLQEYTFGACAGAALYRRKMLDEIGFFDKEFFLIYEDTDLNFGAQLAGWKVMYVPTAIVSHKVRSTIGHMSEMAIFYSLRNSELVRIKNLPFLLFLRCLPVLIIGSIFEFLYFAIKYRKPRLYLEAKIDALKSLQGSLRKRKCIMQMMKKVDNKYLYSIMTPVWNKEFFTMKIKKLIYG